MQCFLVFFVCFSLLFHYHHCSILLFCGEQRFSFDDKFDTLVHFVYYEQLLFICLFLYILYLTISRLDFILIVLLFSYFVLARDGLMLTERLSKYL